MLRQGAALLTIGLLSFGSNAWAQDADADGVPDGSDALPCDAQYAGISYAPAEATHGLLLFEDQWPSAGDLDFNDVVVTYNYELLQDGAGQVSAVHATYNVIAVGGDFLNGLGLHLPVAAQNVATVTRTLENGAPETLVPSALDTELVVPLSNNLRELFGNASGPINSVGASVTDATRFSVDVVFSTPVTLGAGAAPYDLFIFRTLDPSHEIHSPGYAGTAAMNQALFGTADDGSSPGRAYVDLAGLPFALDVPSSALYPAEAQPITILYPDLAGFAASGGAQNQDFYATQVDLTAAFAGTPLVPRMVGATVVDNSCVASTGAEMFTNSGTFTPPPGVSQVRVLLVGGGAGGGGGHQGGGGSGYVVSSLVNVSGPVTVTVGQGGAGAAGSTSNDKPSGSPGTASSFGSLVAAGGESTPGINTRGGNGGSGGGGSGNAGLGAAGGTNGGDGARATYSGGAGQGDFGPLFADFSTGAFSAGAGGAGGTSSHGGGGGGGGVMIDGQGPTASHGPNAQSGKGGQGYGAGGGAGGYSSSWSPQRAAGGRGASGVVYVEWASGGSTPTPSPEPTPTPNPGTQSQLFTSDGTFTPPSGVSQVRVVLIGGGGGGGGGHQGGGGSGYVASGTYTVSGPVVVSVGRGGVGALGSSSNNYPSGGNGTASSFGGFVSAAGGQTTPGINTRGGHGGSGGGGSGNAGLGAAGGSNGSNGYAATYVGGTGQGSSFAAGLAIAQYTQLAAGAGGAGGISSHGGGGGGGGVLVNGAGPVSGAQDGADSRAGQAGEGYGAGGGAGGCCQSTPTRAGGGDGGDGFVYVEWD